MCGVMEKNECHGMVERMKTMSEWRLSVHRAKLESEKSSEEMGE